VLRKLKVPAIALVFALNIPTLHAGETDAFIERLMDVSGVSQSIAAVPKMVASEMGEEQLTAEIGDPQIAGVVSRAMQSSLTASLFERRIVEALRDRLSNEEVASLLTWFDTPLGKRVASANQTDQWAVEQRVMAGERPQLTAERKALVQKLDQVMMGSDNAMQLAIDSAAVMGHTMMTSMGMPMDFEDFRQMVVQQMQGEKAGLVEEYHASLGFIYESLSDADMEQMIAYMIQPEATVFCDAMWSGMRAAFHEGGSAMGLALVAELQESF